MFHFRVRNGTGWDHQAMTTRLQEALLAACPAVLLRGIVAGRLTSAWHGFVLNSVLNLALSKLVTGGDAIVVYEVNWMLVVLG